MMREVKSSEVVTDEPPRINPWHIGSVLTFCKTFTLYTPLLFFFLTATEIIRVKILPPLYIYKLEAGIQE